ncbi:MAG: hypothetical protein QW587_11330 [Candidatus Bathyarchaeia archaeon]
MRSRPARSSLDALLNLLEDGDWHSMDQIAAKLRIPEEKLLIALRFLSEFSFVEFREEWREARVTAHTRKWLTEAQLSWLSGCKSRHPR